MPADMLRIWCNFPFREPAATLLRAGTVQEQLVHLESPLASPRDPDATGDTPQDMDILFGQPDPVAMISSQFLRWVHLSSAGYTRYDRTDLRAAFHARGTLLTNSSAVFADPCAQHLAAMILALARRLPSCVDNQHRNQAWLQHERHGRNARLLGGEVVVIYGFGAIGRRLAKLLAPLQMRIYGVRRSPGVEAEVPVLTSGQAWELLPEADHVVNILPESDHTQNFFGRTQFQRFKQGARFYNIGRGATVDQQALLEALRASWVESAYLDVTDPEPLPPEHPLWHEPNCWVTPHVAGSHINEEERLVQHFLRNLAAFKAGRPLNDRVL